MRVDVDDLGPAPAEVDGVARFDDRAIADVPRERVEDLGPTPDVVINDEQLGVVVAGEEADGVRPTRRTGVRLDALHAPPRAPDEGAKVGDGSVGSSSVADVAHGAMMRRECDTQRGRPA
jgi:hypothetical protein